MSRRRAGKQSPDRLDRLTVPADDATDVGLAQLHAKDRHFSRRNLREHHFVGEFDELANDELEELFHDAETTRSFRGCHAS